MLLLIYLISLNISSIIAYIGNIQKGIGSTFLSCFLQNSPSSTGPVFLRIQVLSCSGLINFRKATGTACTVTTEAVGAAAQSFAVEMGCEGKGNKLFWRQDLKHKSSLLSAFLELQRYCALTVSTVWECFFFLLFCKDNFHVNCSFGAEKVG